MIKKTPRRDVNGILLLDKDTGNSSNHALQQAKRLFLAKKAGHTGSLDPLASGLLPLCFGEATKFSQYLLDSDKTYLVTAQLGMKTNSGDTEGEILKTHEVPSLTVSDINRLLLQFMGPIDQIPSMYSALKHQGKRLYELARQGVEVERPARQVTIRELKLLDWDNERVLKLYIRCSKGTYVRTLIDDIGDLLGCGGTVTALRRLGVGPFETRAQEQSSKMYTLAELQDCYEAGGYASIDALLLPMDTAVSHWPTVTVNPAMAFYISTGQAVRFAGLPDSGWVRFVGENSRFLGVGEVLDDGRVAPKRLVR